jgi:hypothetical protein
MRYVKWLGTSSHLHNAFESQFFSFFLDVTSRCSQCSHQRRPTLSEPQPISRLRPHAHLTDDKMKIVVSIVRIHLEKCTGYSMLISDRPYKQRCLLWRS